MKYMFLMYGAENAWNADERKDCMMECLSLCNELAAKGKFIATSPLQSVTTAKTVRVRGGQTLLTDGPFAETAEQLGGFFILDLANLDEAIAVAGRLPPVQKGTAEIRPLFALDGLPPSKPIPVGWKNNPKKPYMMLCYDDEAAWKEAGPAALQDAMAEALSLCKELDAAGDLIAVSPLHGSDTATCVSMRGGKRTITDGPFTETREVLGGFYIILAESQEAALGVAVRHSGVRRGSVEVRPLFDLVGLK